MTSPSFADTRTVQELKSVEQEELLNAIDKLRRESVDADIDIPQVVVCGDTSTGKSSVLEALAQVKFPIGDGVVTRFATEVMLRNAAAPGIKVELRASKDRTQDEKKRVEEFRPVFDLNGQADFPKLMRAAEDHLKSIDPAAMVWGDWLRTTISGPEQPHLTLVDLPGLVQSESAARVNTGDKAKIRNLVSRYLQNSRTICVAIVSATYDKGMQEIIEMVKASPATLSRTIGVITKPDLVKSGSDREKAVFNLANNEDILLGLGWHVVRNLEHEDNDRSASHQAEIEDEFFSKGIWSSLATDSVGIGALRKRLSQGLLNCISNRLPGLVGDMRLKLKVSEDRLGILGPGRETAQDQRAYLVQMAPRFSRLMEAALESDTSKREFESFFAVRDRKALRETISTILFEFASDMRTGGQLRQVTNGVGSLRRLPSVNSAKVVHVTTSDAHAYCSKVAAMMSKCRGTLLPGQTPPNVVSAIFREQSSLWKQICHKHTQRCVNAVYNFVKPALLHIAGPHTGEKLKMEYTNPAIDDRARRLDEKINDLLWPYTKCHPMTYNSLYVDMVSSLKSTSEPADQEDDIKGTPDKQDMVWTSIALKWKWDIELVDAAEAIDRAEAYYKIAITNFVDNIATLAVEACLLDGLPDLLPVNDLLDLPSDDIARLAAEPPTVVNEREKLEAQIKALKEAIIVCNRHISGDRTETQSLATDIPIATKSTSVGTGNITGRVTPDRDSRAKHSSSTSTEQRWPSTGGGRFGSSTTTPNGTNTTTSSTAFRSGPFASVPTTSWGGFGSGTAFGQQAPSSAVGNKPTSGSTDSNHEGAGLSAGSSSFGQPSNTGTGGWPYHVVTEADHSTGIQKTFQSLTAHPKYQHRSFEELRLEDYLAGRGGSPIN